MPRVQSVRIADLATRSGVVFSPFRMMHDDPVVPVLHPPISVMPLLMTVVVAPRFLPGRRRGWNSNGKDHRSDYRDRSQSVPDWTETRSSHGGLPQAFLSDNLRWSSGAWSKASRRATGRAGSKSGSIPMSIPSDSRYIRRDAKGTVSLLRLAMWRTKSTDSKSHTHSYWPE